MSRTVIDPRPLPSPGLGHGSRNGPGGFIGAMVAVLLLALGSAAAALFSLFVFPYASATCGNTDTYLICTAAGQKAVIFGPSLTSVAGTAVAGYSLSLRPRDRALGIGLGYLIASGGFLTALVIATQAST